jgi:general secretion pathway protein G
MRSKEAVLKENLFTTRTAINLYFADKGKYPESLQALVDDQYINRVPYDPISQSSETWELEYADVAGDDVMTEAGVVNLHSGAEGMSLDGEAFADW